MKGIIVFLRDRRPKTIARDRADTAADELLALARSEGKSVKRPSAWNPIHSWPELESIDPVHRQRVLREANRKANNQWQVVLVFLLWLSAIVGAYLFLPVQWKGTPVYVAVAVVLAVPFVLVRRAYVIRHIVALKASRLENKE